MDACITSVIVLFSLLQCSEDSRITGTVERFISDPHSDTVRPQTASHSYYLQLPPASQDNHVATSTNQIKVFGWAWLARTMDGSNELLRLLREREEDILPSIHALYLASSPSESGDSDDPEREWREAIRAALEEVHPSRLASVLDKVAMDSQVPSYTGLFSDS